MKITQICEIYLASAVDSNGEVLGELIPVHKDHDNVYLEFNLELGVDDSRARVDLWEHHVKWDLHLSDNITICNLNVLHFSCKGFSFECLYSYQLYFYRFDNEL